MANAVTVFDDDQHHQHEEQQGELPEIQAVGVGRGCECMQWKVTFW